MTACQLLATRFDRRTDTITEANSCGSPGPLADSKSAQGALLHLSIVTKQRATVTDKKDPQIRRCHVLHLVPNDATASQPTPVLAPPDPRIPPVPWCTGNHLRPTRAARHRETRVESVVPESPELIICVS